MLTQWNSNRRRKVPSLPPALDTTLLLDSLVWTLALVSAALAGSLVGRAL